MKALKLLSTSALVATIAITSQGTRSMEKFSPPSVEHVANKTFTVFNEPSLITGALYHQVKTEDYRSKVKNLRQEGMELNNKIRSCTSSSKEYDDTNEKINFLREVLELQKEALDKYGSDEKTARDKINEEIQTLNSAKQKIIDEPGSQSYKDSLIKDVEDQLKTCEKHLKSLTESRSILESRLNSSLRYLNTITNDPEARSSFENALNQKKRELQELYNNHVIKLTADIDPNHLSEDFMALLGISQEQLVSVNKDRLFQLLARTLELPFDIVQTGEDIKTSYLDQLKVVKSHLSNRIQEDMLTLQLSNSLSQKRDINFFGNNLNTCIQNILTNHQVFKTAVNKSDDLEKLKSILTRYERLSEESPDQILNKVLELSDYGLFGLYVYSLETFPISSWNNPSQIFPFARVKGAKSPEEFSSIVFETVFNILGRHINMQVLEKVQGDLEKGSKGSSKALTTSGVDFYI